MKAEGRNVDLLLGRNALQLLCNVEQTLCGFPSSTMP